MEGGDRERQREEKLRKQGSRKCTGTCLKNSWREENLPRLLVVFSHLALIFYTSSQYTRPPVPLKPPPPTPQARNREGKSVSIA